MNIANMFLEKFNEFKLKVEYKEKFSDYFLSIIQMAASSVLQNVKMTHIAMFESLTLYQTFQEVQKNNNLTLISFIKKLEKNINVKLDLKKKKTLFRFSTFFPKQNSRIIYLIWNYSTNIQKQFSIK